MGCSLQAMTRDMLHKSDIFQPPPAPLPDHIHDAPITRLPDEILAEIFHQGHISSEEVEVPFRVQEPKPQKLGVVYSMSFLSCVCLVTRRWREVAIDTSSLWTRLVLRPERTSEFIAMYLHRSKNRPLVIHFSCLHGAIAPKKLHPIFQLLILSAYRWYKLTISLHDGMPVGPILHYLRDLEVPLLQSISVVGGRQYNSAPFTRHIFLPGAPRLSRVYLSGISLQKCWPPMDNVTSFHIHAEVGHGYPRSSVELCQALEALPCVTNLILRDVYTKFSPGDIKRRITMCSLRRLVIQALHSGRVWDEVPYSLQHFLAEAIWVPNLETLVIVGEPWHSSLGNTFESLATPPLKFPALTSLELWDTNYIGLTRHFLQSIPNIEKLTLMDGNEPHGLLQLLLNEEVPILLPRLQKLTLGTKVTSHWQDLTTMGLICELVPTRVRLGVSIHRLRLQTLLYHTDQDCIELLQRHVQVEEYGVTEFQWHKERMEDI